MKALANEYGERVFAISDREWFNELIIGKRAEDIIAQKLADTFTNEELQKLVKIDMKKIERKVVDSCMKSNAFKEKE